MLLVDLALATWRLSSLLVNEAGPWHIFQKLRKASGITYDENNDIVSWNDWTPLTCVLCTSLYVGLLIRLVPRPVRRALAISAIAVIVEKLYDSMDARPSFTVNVVTSAEGEVFANGPSSN